MKESLSTAFGDSLKMPITECLSGLAEVGLDALTENEVIKNIPILSTAISVYKIGDSLLERHNLKKTIAFLDEINKGIADEQKRSEYQQKFQANDKFRNQELEYLLVLINRYIGYEKPRMLAKIYLAYLNEKIDWSLLCRYSEIVDSFLTGDHIVLNSNAFRNIPVNDTPDSIIRLASLGLIYEEEYDVNVDNTIGTITIPTKILKNYSLTKFGKIFVSILNDN